MPVVSNTSPLLNLAVVSRLHLVAQQFGSVLIPPAVLDELRVDEERPGSGLIRGALADGWLEVAPVEDRALVEALARDLDRGEAEAIALAIQVKAARVLLDERDARRVARVHGLQLAGTLGILVRAHRDAQIPSLSQAIDDLREQAGFRLAPALVARVSADVENR